MIARGILAGLLLATATPMADEGTRIVTIHLDPETPANSFGQLVVPGKPTFRFPVGFGKEGVTGEGKPFRGGSSLLGTFRVNAILTKSGKFEMTRKLIAESGRSKDSLREKLFADMSSIDFDGDGKGGEYGAAFIGLQPVSDAKQPFHFGEYKGVFRWYTYALHGTQDETRIGKRVTGGCINLGADSLAKLAGVLQLGDTVRVRLLRQDQ